jgi:hypothetical protein
LQNKKYLVTLSPKRTSGVREFSYKGLPADPPAPKIIFLISLEALLSIRYILYTHFYSFDCSSCDEISKLLIPLLTPCDGKTTSLFTSITEGS